MLAITPVQNQSQLIFMNSVHISLLVALFIILACSKVAADEPTIASMLASPSGEAQHAWKYEPLLTIGDNIDSYIPPGVPDGMGVLQGENPDMVDLYVNHELHERQGYPYKLANGTLLTGARISRLTVDRRTRKTVSAGLAYSNIIDRWGQPVTSAHQINERNHGKAGLSRLCSARMVEAGSAGFSDDIYLTGEESGRKDSHGRGGSAWALDMTSRTLWAAPDMGRGAWENMTPVQSAHPNQIALLLGDDTPGAPLYLYTGLKRANGNFINRNGLSGGQLYCWQADNGATTPADFHGTGRSLGGRFSPVTVRDPGQAGKQGYDNQGYLNGDRLRKQALQSGCFSFSRPEDLHNNPANPAHAVFSSTGRIGLYEDDFWGTLYTVEIDVSKLTARLNILYDSDDKNHRDEGIRSPDNLTWAANNHIYVQEDNAMGFGFFGANGKEASIWEIEPDTGSATRIAMIDRSVILPKDGHDRYAGKTGAWESSGIIDVSRLFATRPGQTVLLANVQAHGIHDGRIGGKNNLVQSGQVIFLTYTP